MKSVRTTRLLHWKKQWIHLLFWLLFPIVATLVTITLVNAVQEETKVPVGLVLEEETPLTIDLYEAMKTVPLLRVHKLNETVAMDQLNKHQLDSVFIIRKGYEKNIRKESRNRLVIGYQSDLSLAYLPTEEIILSYVQQDAGRSKSAYVVKQLSEQYDDHKQWTWDEIIDQSKHIQVEQQLLHTTFSFKNSSTEMEETGFTLVRPWSIWALSTLLATFLLFDWLIKERRQEIMPRFAFMRMSFKKYLIKNLGIYILLMLVFDLIAMFVFYFFLGESIHFPLVRALFFYRLLISLGAFLVALPFKQTHTYYSVSFIITLLLAIGSGALLPIDGIINKYPWFEQINPLHAFLTMKWLNVWLLICLTLIIIWYMRKENDHASR